MSEHSQKNPFTSRLEALERRGCPGGMKERVAKAAFARASATSWLPPRWVAGALAAAWVVIAAMQFVMPAGQDMTVELQPAERIDASELAKRQELLAALELGRLEP